MAVCEEAAAAATEAKGSYGFGIGEELVAWLPVVQVGAVALRVRVLSCE